MIKIEDKFKSNTFNNKNHLNNEHQLQQQLDDIQTTYDLNTSNLSTKSLTTGTNTSPTKINGNTNGWLESYRQPIVGPYG